MNPTKSDVIYTHIRRVREAKKAYRFRWHAPKSAKKAILGLHPSLAVRCGDLAMSGDDHAASEMQNTKKPYTCACSM